MLEQAVELEPVEADFNPFQQGVSEAPEPYLALSDTASLKLTQTRSKQSLFKRRLLTVEKQCRLTGIADLRFLRASHIKPWARNHHLPATSLVQDSIRTSCLPSNTTQQTMSERCAQADASAFRGNKYLSVKDW